MVRDLMAALEGGDAIRALELAQRAVRGPNTDLVQEVIVRAAAALGDYDKSIAAYREMDRATRESAELDDVVLEAMLHADRVDEAADFAASADVNSMARARAELRQEHPMSIAIDGVVEIPFHQDGLTPAMPGFVVAINGEEHIGRIDTGGAFVHLSPVMADELGVETSECATGNANAQETKYCIGVVDVAVEGVVMKNAPVSVIDSLPSGEVLGGTLGPVLGTNFLQRFLSTIDPHAGRLILSPRGDATARASHFERLGPIVGRVPFLLVGDHFILAPGGYGDEEDLTYFVDSGLIAFDSTGRQLTFMGTAELAQRWTGRDLTDGTPIVILDKEISLGEVRVTGGSLLVRGPDGPRIEEMGGIRVDALISNGFLKNFAWTLDFDAREIVLSAPNG